MNAIDSFRQIKLDVRTSDWIPANPGVDKLSVLVADTHFRNRV